MPGKFCPLPKFHFEDGNGNPLANGKLYAYVAGSSTPQTTYQDAALGTPNANPIILNARGEPPADIWLTTGAVYKFVLADSSDVVIWSVDNVSGINDVTTSLDEWVATGLTPTFIGATQFSFQGDQTSSCHVGRRVKTTNTAGTRYGTISNSAFAANVTTITLLMDSGSLDAGLSAVSIGLLKADNSSIPHTKSGASGLVVQFQDGSAAAPSVKVGDEQNGLYSPAANQLAASVGGANGWTLTSTGLTIAAALTVGTVLSLPDGSAAAPSLKIGDEQNGLYSSAANQLAAAVGGANGWTLSTTGLTVPGTLTVNGNVTLGDTDADTTSTRGTVTMRTDAVASAANNLRLLNASGAGVGNAVILSLDAAGAGFGIRDAQIRGVSPLGGNQVGMRFYTANADLPAQRWEITYEGHLVGSANCNLTVAGNATLGDAVGDSHAVNGTMALTVTAGSFGYSAVAAGGGDRIQLTPQVAGSGAGVYVQNNGFTDLEPLSLVAEHISTFARNGVNTTLEVTRTNIAGLIFPTDNTYDIGASGATRPRDLHLGRNAAIAGTLTVAGDVSVTTGADFNIGWGGAQASSWGIVSQVTGAWGVGGTTFTGGDSIPMTSSSGFVGYSGIAVVPNRWGNATTVDDHRVVYIAGAQRNAGGSVASLAFANWGYFTGTGAGAGGLQNATARADAVKFLFEMTNTGEFDQNLTLRSRNASGTTVSAMNVNSAGTVTFGNNIVVVSAASFQAAVSIDGNATIGNNVADAHTITGQTVLTDDNVGGFYVARSGGGDRVRLGGQAAGNGIEIAGENSTGSDYEPIAIHAEYISLQARTGVGTITEVARVTNGAITFPNDNTHDIGASGATRPRHIYASGTVTAAAISGTVTLATPIATTSGTAHDWTGIPSGTKQIVVMINGVSTDGVNGIPIVQLGDSGGVETTGYVGYTNTLATTSGFYFLSATNSGNVVDGVLTINLEDSSDNTWVADGNGSINASGLSAHIFGKKPLSATLDRVRLTTSDGSNFDAGEANIAYIR